jgi:catechol 2,3-dioxygenase-like lactoylglutathione lyase family enzyme
MPLELRGMAPLLQVFDMPTSIRFYCDVLGGEVVTTDGKPLPNNDWVWLQLCGIDLMLNTAYEADARPPVPDPVRLRAHGDTALFFSAPDVDGVHAFLRARGVDAPSPRVASYGMKQLHITDPDGYQLCFQWRVDR